MVPKQSKSKASLAAAPEADAGRAEGAEALPGMRARVLERSTSPDLHSRWKSYGRSHFPLMAQRVAALSARSPPARRVEEDGCRHKAPGDGFDALGRHALPKLMLLTVADAAEAASQGKCLLDVTQDTADVEKAAAKLDGVYVEFQQEMLAPAGQAVMKSLSGRRLVGVWMHAQKHPDSLLTAQHLMHKCGASFVNTDLPHAFEPRHRRHSSARQKKSASMDNVFLLTQAQQPHPPAKAHSFTEPLAPSPQKKLASAENALDKRKKYASMDNVLDVLSAAPIGPALGQQDCRAEQAAVGGEGAGGGGKGHIRSPPKPPGA